MTTHEWRQRKWGKKISVGIGLAIGASLLSASASQAQKQALPPPPSVPGGASQLELAPLPGTVPPPSAPELPTTGYAPAPLPPGILPPAPLPQAAGQFPSNSGSYSAAYQVLVYGDSPYLLRQIRFLEPAASIQDYQGRRVIVAGMFDTEAAARQRVLALGQHGIGAQMLASNQFTPTQPGPEQRVASLSPAPVPPVGAEWNPPSTPLAPVPPLGTAAPNLPTGMAAPFAANPGLAGQVQMPHFQVVVPTPPENFAAIANKMISMGVRPEAIQAKQKPLGPHLAVGPFMQQDEAEAVSRYLKVGGMDARVYYAK